MNRTIFDMQENTWRQLRDAQRGESPSILDLAMLIMERQMPLEFFENRVQLGIQYSDDEADIIRRVNNVFGRLSIHIEPEGHETMTWASLPLVSDPADNPLIERVRAPAVILPRSVQELNPEMRRYAQGERIEVENPAPNWVADTLPAQFFISRDASRILRQRYPELPHDELEEIIKGGARAYFEVEDLETRNRIMESMIVQFYQWEQDHMAHIPESDWPLRLGPQQLQPQQRPEQGTFVEHAEIHDAKLTGNKVSADDLDDLFAEIDELTKEQDDENYTSTDYTE